ncbi:MFS general substrate transporter [Thozetella sp. PMI_491]|nr:MFS general substrate transporter [Thozetella sp. PMI_491]
MESSQTLIELQSRTSPLRRISSPPAAPPEAATSNDAAEAIQQQLAPTDGGIAAWRLLCAAFVFEAFLWGFPLSFGVFQSYYSQLPQFSTNPYLPIVGTIASGISYLGAPLMTPLLKRYSNYRQYMIWLGWPLCIIGLAAGSFATTLGGLIVTQGILYGAGFVISYYPIVSFVSEFWIERRGMAFGLLCASSGVTGAAIPFAVEALLGRFGYQTTLRASAVALAVVTGPLIPLFKGRLPSTRQSAVGRSDWTFLTKPLFWVYFISNFLQGLGFFFPALYLPSHATVLGFSSAQGALLVALLSVAQTCGQFSFGYMSDHRVPLNLLILASTLVSAVAVSALWGLARSMAVLIIFSLIYGFFATGYSAMWARMGSAVSDEPSATMKMFAMFNFGKGVGNVLAGPVSAGLVSQRVLVESYGAFKYKSVIFFSTTSMLCSALCIAALYTGLGGRGTRIPTR